MKAKDADALKGKEFNAILSGGLAEKRGIKASDVDQKALEQGMKHEREHTDDDDTARRIALDHIAEFPTYYDALGEMEARLHRERMEAMDKGAAEADEGEEG